MRLDHVVYAVTDLDAAAARFEAEHGLAAAAAGGGRHAGHGTHNRILPVGGGYIELLAVADPEEAAGSDFGSGLLRRLDQGGEGWLAWAVAVPDVVPVAQRLGTTVTTLFRDGLSARLTGAAEAMAEPCLPFFVSRDPGVPDPGASGDAGGLTWLEVAGDVRRLAAWLDRTPMPLRFTDGPARLNAVGVGDRALR